MPRLLVHLALVAALVACGDDAVITCRVGADCASGVCRGDGSCAPVVDPDATDSDVFDDADVADDTGTPDSGGDGVEDTSQDLDAADGSPGLCVPIDDDEVSRAEMPLRAGLYATFRIASGAAVDLVGTTQDGVTRWDLKGPYPGDADVRVDLQPVTGAWFATDFPGATYAARLSTDSDNLGVFEVSDDALLLRGVVSPEAGLFATKLVYTTPPKIFQFPLKLGATWTTQSDVTGTTLGLPTFISERYVSEVDAAGSLQAPFGTFEVLRVHTTLTRTLSFVPTTTRQIAFVSPCFGTVALAVSNAGESQATFEQAAEVRRLAP